MVGLDKAAIAWSIAIVAIAVGIAAVGLSSDTEISKIPITIEQTSKTSNDSLEIYSDPLSSWNSGNSKKQIVEFANRRIYCRGYRTDRHFCYLSRAEMEACKFCLIHFIQLKPGHRLS